MGVNKVIIAGSRTCPEKDLTLFEKVSGILRNLENIEIVSGTARGADRFGEWLASECGYELTKFPADWDKYGKSAGYIRNKEMAEYATHLVAIIDLSVPSKGSRNMAMLAKEYRLKIRIIYINCENGNYGIIKEL